MASTPVETALVNRPHGLNRSVATQELSETESSDTTDASSYNDVIGTLGPRKGRARAFIYNVTSLLGFGLCITPWGRYRLYSSISDGEGHLTAEAVTWPGTSPAAPSAPTVDDIDASGARARFLQYHYRTYAFNGRDRMRAFDGIDWQFDGIEGGVTWAAQFTPSIAYTSTGLTGQYYYYVVAANSKRLDVSGRPIEAIPSNVSAVANPVNQKVVVGNIPSTHADPQVDTWNIYRTLNGGYDSGLVPDQQDFFLLTTIALGTTSYTDGNADSVLLGAERLRFNQNIAPTFKYGAIYGDRMFGAGFDPIIAGTSTVNGTTTKIDFSGVTLPDGARGAWFQAAGQAAKYRIVAILSTTQIQLDRAFVGALSGSAYTIFRYPWEIYFSEFLDVDAWGPDGDSNRYMLTLPRGQGVVGMAAYNGRLYIFTKDSIFEIYGKGPNRTDVKINPEPAFFGLGAVSHDAIVRVDNELHFLSLRGPAVITGSGEPQLIGIPLLTDWLDTLDATDHELCCAGSDNTRVWYAAPVHGAATTSKTFRYERLTQSWWEETEWQPYMFIRQDGENGFVDQLYYLQGRFVCQPRSGLTDLVPAQIGIITSLSDLGFGVNDTNAAFPTANGGLEETWARFYRNGVLFGNAFIGPGNANTATKFLFTSAPLALQAGDTYEIGNIGWRWVTKGIDYIDPLRKIRTHLAKQEELYVTFYLKDQSATLYRQDIIDGNLIPDLHPMDLKLYTSKWDVGEAAFEVSFLLFSRNGAVIKHAALRGQLEAENV